MAFVVHMYIYSIQGTFKIPYLRISNPFRAYTFHLLYKKLKLFPSAA